ncbi:unnamed protein product, partial [Didymodactylos carnosus]
IPSSNSHQRSFSSYDQVDNSNNYQPTRSRGLTRRIPNSRSYDDRNGSDYVDYDVVGDIDFNHMDNDQHTNHNNNQAQSLIDSNDVTSFEFRQEDFPSLPLNANNHTVNNKQHTSHVHVNGDNNHISQPNQNGTQPSWNIVVSTARPKSSSPTSKSPAITKQRSTSQHSQTSRKSRKEAPPDNKKSKSHERNKTSPNQTKSPLTQQRSVSLNSNNQQDAESAQQKQRRHGRKKSKTKTTKQQEQATTETPSFTSSKIVPFALDDESAFPTLSNSPTTTKKVVKNTTQHPNDPNQTDVSIEPPTTIEKQSQPSSHRKPHPKANTAYAVRLTDMFNALNTTSANKSQQKSSSSVQIKTNPLDSNPVPKRGKEREEPKRRKPTKLKRIINKELEENHKQRLSLKQQPSLDTNNELNNSINDSNKQQYDDTKHAPATLITNTLLNVLSQISNSTSVQDMDEEDDNGSSASCTEQDEENRDDHEQISQQSSYNPSPFTAQPPPPSESLIQDIQQMKQLHHSCFREYCHQLIDRTLDEICVQLLLTLKRFQDRQQNLNPQKAKLKRRYIHGIREVTKHLRLNRLKCILIAPDCERIKTEGGLDDAIEQIITLCEKQSIPYVFTLNRKKLGRCLNKISKISTIGIFDYSGTEQFYKQMLELTHENQLQYQTIVENLHKEQEQEQQLSSKLTNTGLNSKEFFKLLHKTFQQKNQQQQKPQRYIVNKIPKESLSKMLPKVPAHYAHSRNVSDTSTIYIDPLLITTLNGLPSTPPHIPSAHHVRASSGSFEQIPKCVVTKKNGHHRTLSAGATTIFVPSDMIVTTNSVLSAHHTKCHSRTPSGCSQISQPYSELEQIDYYDQVKNVLECSTTTSTINSSPPSDLPQLQQEDVREEVSSHTIRLKSIDEHDPGNEADTEAYIDEEDDATTLVEQTDISSSKQSKRVKKLSKNVETSLSNVEKWVHSTEFRKDDDDDE